MKDFRDEHKHIRNARFKVMVSDNDTLLAIAPIGDTANLADPKVLWHITLGDGPVLGVALHAGHEMRSELLGHLNIDEATRIREEDPYTDYWTQACHSQFVTRRSRFEVDLNRPLDEAICVQPEDCWNLEVWESPVGRAAMDRSYAEHGVFYESLEKLLRQMVDRFGKFVIYDIHSYNHRREGPRRPLAEATANPDINVGTGTMDRVYWSPVVERFMTDLHNFDFLGRHLDVRENVNFKGRQLAAFVHQTFPETGCVLAIEVKKFFMDEWTGVAIPEMVNGMLDALRFTIPGVVSALDDM